jgi:hypothetical protein
VRKLRGLGVAAVVLVAAGCSSTTPGVSNGSVSACYRAIPVGRSAVHNSQARLIGVHRVPVDTVRDRLPPSARAELAAEDDTAVCAMAFKGTFTPGQVALAPPGDQGRYAIVLVSSRKLHLVASIVLDHLPHSFGARTI